MQLSLNIGDRDDIVGRALQATMATSPLTIEAAIAELQAQYTLQLASHVPLSDKRDTVASLIDSSLPSDVQDQISDTSVITVFADLVRAGLVSIEVDWIEG